MITRKYLIDSFAMSENDNHSIYPLKLLLSNPSVSHHISSFKHFRADVKLEIIMVSNRAQAGTVLVSTLPYRFDTGTPPNNYDHTTQRIQANGHFLDVSRQESLELSLPFLSPHRYHDIESSYGQWKLMFSMLNFAVTTADAPTNCNFQVWANLEKVRTFGYKGEFQSSMGQKTLPGFLSAATSFVGDIAAIGFIAANRWAGVGQAQEEIKQQTDGSEPEPERAKSEFSKPVKPQLCPDLNGAGADTIYLGDPIRGYKHHLPRTRNYYSMQKLCSTPAYVGKYTYSAPSDSNTFQVQALPQYSYQEYLSRCFKYYRTDVHVMFRIEATQDVSAKMKLLLHPTGQVNDSPGDLPTWEISVRGTTDFSFVVPYMEKDHWLETYEEVTPQFTLSLMGPIPQIFDTAPSLTVHVMYSSPNITFASLQSPCEGSFQAEIGSLYANPETFGPTYVSQAMGGYPDVRAMMSRFSSRDVELNNLFPFPVRKTTSLFQYDIYDYLNQLYLFYTGSVDIKYFFSSTPPDGLLELITGNSHTVSANGNTMKAGNSMILSSQSVWPLLEFNFPYERTVEFDCIDDPQPHYIPEFSQEAVVSKILLRPGEDFQHFTLMPVPDFAADIEAVFQSSIQRQVGFSSEYVSTTANSSGSAINIGVVPNNGSTFRVELEGYVRRVSGTSDGEVAVALSTSISASSNSAILTTSCILGSIVPWTDVSNSGKNHTKFRMTAVVASYVPANWFFKARASSGTYEVNTVIRVFPFKTTAVPLTPDVTTSNILLPPLTTSPLSGSTWPISSAAPLAVTAPSPLAVTALSPLPVTSPTPLTVQASGNFPVTTPLPIDVKFLSPQAVTVPQPLQVSGTVAVQQPLQVIGIVDPDVPVWVTNYKPV